MKKLILLAALFAASLAAADTAEPLALVNIESGKVQTFIRPDVPAGWTAPAGYKTVAKSALPVGYVMETPPAAPVHRILKDTLIQRVKAANKLAALRTIIAGLNDDQRFEWDNSSWFSSDNPMIVAGVAGLQLDAAVILAEDPLAPEAH